MERAAAHPSTGIAPEHRGDFDAMPIVLRDLLVAELASGNAIVEVGHSFPAPPAGAYFRLANKVSTRPRASSEGLQFCERNSSLYSGEFTDADRFYFILEPPDPPPAEPDMDAIRKAAEGPAGAFASRDAGSVLQDIGRVARAASRPGRKRRSGNALTSTETPTGAKRVLHFRDTRPPEDIQFALERILMVLFTPAMTDARLTMTATAKLIGATYDVALRFEAAMPRENCYTLSVEASWPAEAAAHDDYYRKTSGSWFAFWTRDFEAADPPSPGTGSARRYRDLCEAAMTAEQHLATITAIQQAIVTAMKKGARFTTAHKEGGTTITWNGERFVRSDYGDDPDFKIFAGEADFLAALRQFYDWETSKNLYPGKASDLAAWKLILRLLRAA